MDEDLGGMLVALLNGNMFAVDARDYDSSIRDNSRYSRGAFFWPTGCELLAFEKMLGMDKATWEAVLARSGDVRRAGGGRRRAAGHAHLPRIGNLRPRTTAGHLRGRLDQMPGRDQGIRPTPLSRLALPVTNRDSDVATDRRSPGARRSGRPSVERDAGSGDPRTTCDSDRHLKPAV